MEPIYLAQKPYEGKPVESILKWGVGAFNIDGCRVSSEPRPVHEPTKRNGAVYGSGLEGSRRTGEMRVDGRYPANVLHDGSDVVVALFPDSAGQQGAILGNEPSKPLGGSVYGHGLGRQPAPVRGDSGSAARFFNSFPSDEMSWPLAFYHAKAGKADRAGSKHPTVKPIGLLRHLMRHIAPAGSTILDPFAGSGTTAEAARLEGMDCVLMEAEPEYLAFLRERFVSEIEEDIFA
jgi:site-specific DNA-methyltransferase (adenine-specific)